MEEKSIFVLEMKDVTKIRRKHRDDYQNFDVTTGFTAFYNDLRSAEEAMRQMLENNSLWPFDIYCFYIHEIPGGQMIHSYDESLNTRLYNPEGMLVDERPYPAYTYGSWFKGRPKEKLRFKPGDVVEYRDILTLVITVPREHYDINLDNSDDSYCLIPVYIDNFDDDGIIHYHAECIKVMPPRFPINKKLQDKINEMKKRYKVFIKP